MKIKDYKDGKIFIFSSPLDSLSKALFFTYFCMFFGILLISLRELMMGEVNGIGYTFFTILAMGGSSIASFRFVNKALFGEKVFLNKSELKVIHLGLFGSSNKSYDVSKISYFRHLEKPQLTKHPLAGDSFDYLGAQTEQQVINELHGDNRLAFDYEGRSIFLEKMLRPGSLTNWNWTSMKLQGMTFGTLMNMKRKISLKLKDAANTAFAKARLKS